MAQSGILAGIREVVTYELEDQRLKAQASALQSHRDQQLGIQKEQNRLAFLGLQHTQTWREGQLGIQKEQASALKTHRGQQLGIQEEQNSQSLEAMHQLKAWREAQLKIDQGKLDLDALKALSTTSGSSSRSGTSVGKSSPTSGRYKPEHSEETQGFIKSHVTRSIDSLKKEVDPAWTKWPLRIFEKDIPKDRRLEYAWKYGRELQQELERDAGIPRDDHRSLMDIGFDHFMSELGDTMTRDIQGVEANDIQKKRLRARWHDQPDPYSTGDMDAVSKAGAAARKESRTRAGRTGETPTGTTSTTPTSPQVPTEQPSTGALPPRNEPLDLPGLPWWAKALDVGTEAADRLGRATLPGYSLFAGIGERMRGEENPTSGLEMAASLIPVRVPGLRAITKRLAGINRIPSLRKGSLRLSALPSEIQGTDETLRPTYTPPYEPSPEQTQRMNEGAPQYQPAPPPPSLETYLAMSPMQQAQTLQSLPDDQRSALLMAVYMYRRENPSVTHTLPTIPMN